MMELSDIQKYLSDSESRKVAGVIDATSMSGAGGLTGTLFRVEVEFEDESKQTYVLKTMEYGDKSKHYGLPREALFYKEWKTLLSSSSGDDQNLSLLQQHLPNIYYAHGDMDDGTKIILMEDMSDGALVGHFYGPGSPLNWSKDLEALTKGKGFEATAKELTRLAFDFAAHLHAASWMPGDELTTVSWLRGAAWVRGEGRDDWEDRQARGAEFWNDCKTKGKNDEIKLDPLVYEFVEASINKALPEAGGWDTFQNELKSTPTCLVHGDFHPGNMLLCPENRLVVVDWEMVAIASGPQELGQYVISHATPEFREQVERDLVREYYDTLCKLNPAVSNSMTFDECWKEYVIGGLGKWLYMLPLLGMMCPAPMYQYFHDQVLAFIKSHGLTSQDAPLPRV